MKNIMFDRLKSFAIINLRGWIVSFVFLFSLSFYAQTFPTNRYYQVILKVDNVDTKLSQHTTQLYAENKLNCRDGYIIAPTGKVLGPLTVKCPEVFREMEVDYVNKLVHLYGGVISPTGVVFDDCTEKYIVTKLPEQKIPNHTFKATLQRTKNFKEATTTYNLIDIPFYFVKGDSIVEKTATTITLRTFASATHCIFQYVNGVKINAAEYCTPGLAVLDGVNVYRHTHRGLPYDTTKQMVYRFEAIDEKTREVLGAVEFSMEPNP